MKHLLTILAAILVTAMPAMAEVVVSTSYEASDDTKTTKTIKSTIVNNSHHKVTDGDKTYKEAPSPLQVEKFFDVKYTKNNKGEFTLIKSNNNVYYRLEFKDDPGLVSQIQSAIEQDKKYASNLVERVGNGYTKIVLNLVRNGGMLSLGFDVEGNYCRVFLQGSPKGFQ